LIGKGKCFTTDAVGVKTNKFHILHENTPFQAEIITSDFLQKKLHRQGKQQHLHRCYFKSFGYLIKMGFEIGLRSILSTPMPD
jgi:hypothetical protein